MLSVEGGGGGIAAGTGKGKEMEPEKRTTGGGRYIKNLDAIPKLVELGGQLGRINVFLGKLKSLLTGGGNVSLPKADNGEDKCLSWDTKVGCYTNCAWSRQDCKCSASEAQTTKTCIFEGLKKIEEAPARS